MHRVVIVGFDGAHGLDLVGPLEVFDAAGRVATDDRRRNGVYTVDVVSLDGSPFRTASGLRIQPDRSLVRLRGHIDTLVVAGGVGVRAQLEDGALGRRLKTLAPRATRIASVCTGAFLLAQAGLLDGCRATTHWASCASLAARYPDVEVCKDAIFVRSGTMWTSAGVTAGMDLALAMVEHDLGREVARTTARWLVLFVQRGGGQSQFSAQLEAEWSDVDRIRELQRHIAEHPEDDLRVPALARRAGMSPRHFARVFRDELGVTPAAYVEQVRVEVASRLLERTSLGLDAIADTVGLVSAQRLRRAFQRRLHVAPSTFRARFGPPRKAIP